MPSVTNGSPSSKIRIANGYLSTKPYSSTSLTVDNISNTGSGTVDPILLNTQQSWGAGSLGPESWHRQACPSPSRSGFKRTLNFRPGDRKACVDLSIIQRLVKGRDINKGDVEGAGLKIDAEIASKCVCVGLHQFDESTSCLPRLALDLLPNLPIEFVKLH